MELCDSKLKELNATIERNKGEMGMLMPILHDSQKIFGCIPYEVQKIISEQTKIPLAEIYGVITFYSHFSIEPKGEYIVGVCMGTACYVKDAGKILDDISKEINIKAGETSEDGRFTLEATRCIGACGLAPLITVNEEVYVRLTADTTETLNIIAKYQQ